MLKLDKAIGGYMELELPKREQPWLEGALKYNSARSAFVSLLKQLSIRSVWMPRYICNSMINAVTRQGIQVYYYSINQNFEIVENVAPSRSTPLLYVNYFGVCESQAKEVIERFGPGSVIIDNAQALYSKPFDCLGTIYSPRKFFGLPDGGLLFTKYPNARPPKIRDDSSINRMTHLISRLSGGPESAYAEYLRAEKEIGLLPVMAMSNLTNRLLGSIDYDNGERLRARNAKYLQQILGEKNKLAIELPDDTAPLCYPFYPSVQTLSRAEMIENRIFIPSYWTEVLSRVTEDSFEARMVKDVFYIPCDQRYQIQDLQALVNLFVPRA